MIEINWDPSRKELRLFAGGLALLAGLLVVLGASAWRWSNGAIVLFVVVVFGVIALAVLRPTWLRPLYLGWMMAVFPIGWIVSHAILAIVYFALFLPIGLALRVTGYDPLFRKPKPPGESYWLERKPVTSRERYFRQY